jgi:hypothetical protein
MDLATRLCLPLVCLAAALPSISHAQSNALTAEQHLRRMSLDLRNMPPIMAEYAELAGRSGTDREQRLAALAARFTKGDEFRRAMQRYHEHLLWPSVSGIPLASGRNMLEAGRYNQPTYPLVVTEKRMHLYRGSPPPSGPMCGDYEQTHFDPAYPGEFRPDLNFVRKIDNRLEEG